MKKNYTHISLLLDRSGSMSSTKSDVIGGFNTFLETQKLEPGELTMSFSQFDSDYDEIAKFTPIEKINNLTNETFVPRGSTALLKYATKLINDTGAVLKEMKEENRPEKILFVMITDGEENASNDHNPGYRKLWDGDNNIFTSEKLKVLTTHQQDKYNWQFVYIGANQDAFATGNTYGTRGVNYTADSLGTGKVFRAMSKSVSSYRSSNASATFNLSQDDVDKA